MTFKRLFGKICLIQAFALAGIGALGAATECERPQNARAGVVFYLGPDSKASGTFDLKGGYQSDGELRLRSACGAMSQQSQRLGSSIPKSCEGLTDIRLQDSQAKGLVDPSRCIATSVVANFKKSLRAALRPEKKGSARHQYSAGEVKSLMQKLWAGCSSLGTLYERHSCMEDSAHSLFDKFAASRESLLKDSKGKWTNGDVCKALRVAGLDRGGIDFLSAVAQNQFRPEHLSAKDYPGYLDCRPYEFKKILAGCEESKFNASQPFGDGAAECLLGALKFTAENHKACNVLTRAGESCAFTDALAELRERALELSIFSRACQADLNFKSLFDPSIKPVMTDEVKRRCLTAEVLAIDKMNDLYAWLESEEKNQKKPPAFDDREIKKAAVADCDVPVAKVDERLTGAARQMMRMVKVIPDPSLERKPTREEVKKEIRKAFERKRAQKSAPAAEKRRLDKLQSDKKFQGQLENKLDVESDVGELGKIADQEIAKALEKVAESEAKTASEQKGKEKESTEEAVTLSESAEVAGDKGAGLTEKEQEEIRQQLAQPDPAPLSQVREELKKEIQSPKAPDAASASNSYAQIRSSGELIGEARSALQEFKDKKTDSVDLSRFLMESELLEKKDPFAQKDYERFQRDWNAHLAEYRSISEKTEGGADEKIQAVLTKLHADYLSRYSRDYAKLTDFFRGYGGNCEAETKMILSVMRALNLEPQDGKKWGAQVFADHIQAVIYDPKNNAVLNVLSGEKKQGVEAPIYDQRLIFHAYLEGRGEDSPTRNSDLLLVDANVNRLSKMPTHLPYSTNSKLKLPDAPMYAANGRIPETAVVPAPKAQEKSASKTNAGLSFLNGLWGVSDGKKKSASNSSSPFGGEGMSESGRTDLISSLEDLPPKDYEKLRTYISLPDKDGYQHKFYLRQESFGNINSALVFKTRAQKEEYEARPPGPLREEYLLDLHHQEAAELLNQPELGELLALVRDPTKLTKMSRMDVLRIREFSLHISGLNFLGSFKSEREFFFKNQKKGALPGLLTYAEEFPILKELWNADRDMSIRVIEHPKALLKVMDNVEPAIAMGSFQLLAWQSSEAARVGGVPGYEMNSSPLRTFFEKYLLAEDSKVTFRPVQRGRLPNVGEAEVAEVEDIAAKKTILPLVELRPTEPSQREEEMGQVATRARSSLDEGPVQDKTQPARREQTKVDPQSLVLPETAKRGATQKIGKKDVQVVKNPRRSEVRLNPAFYISLLIEMENSGWREDIPKDSAAMKKMTAILKKWTPELSHALRAAKTVPYEVLRLPARVFVSLSETRPLESRLYPGPWGDKVPLDVALLVRDILRKRVKDNLVARDLTDFTVRYRRNKETNEFIKAADGRFILDKAYPNQGAYLDALEESLKGIP